MDTIKQINWSGFLVVAGISLQLVARTAHAGSCECHGSPYLDIIAPEVICFGEAIVATTSYFCGWEDGDPGKDKNGTCIPCKECSCTPVMPIPTYSCPGPVTLTATMSTPCGETLTAKKTVHVSASGACQPLPCEPPEPTPDETTSKSKGGPNDGGYIRDTYPVTSWLFVGTTTEWDKYRLVNPATMQSSCGGALKESLWLGQETITLSMSLGYRIPFTPISVSVRSPLLSWTYSFGGYNVDIYSTPAVTCNRTRIKYAEHENEKQIDVDGLFQAFEVNPVTQQEVLIDQQEVSESKHTGYKKVGYRVGSCNEICEES